jgi:MbtH protein
MSTIFKVVVNREGQYSIWPTFLETPLGWRDSEKTGEQDECLDYIERVWVDMRPRSVLTDLNQ